MFDFLKKIFGLPTEKEIAEARRAQQAAEQAAAQVPYKVEAPAVIETVSTPTQPAKKVEEAKPAAKKTRKPRAKKVEVVAVKEKATKPVAKRTVKKSKA